MTDKRRRIMLAFAGALLALAGCRSEPQTTPAPEARPAAREAPFVARIRSVRGNVIFVQEEGGENRRAEIYVSPGTEITTRDGAMFIPMTNLRANMRVTVWFSGEQRSDGVTLTASARRMLVDY